MFIANNHEEVEEVIAETDNKLKVDIEIVKEKVDEPITDTFSVEFAESDDKEEKNIECVIV